MKLEDLIQNTGEWLKGTGPYAHIVMSSRIRLARNLKKYSFPNKARKKELTDVQDMVESAAPGNRGVV